MAGGIFNPENGIYRFTEKLADLVILSVFWLVCSIPVVTIGPATAALYNTVARCIWGNERNSWGMFFRTFRENIKVGVLTTLVILPVAVVLVFIQGQLYRTAVEQVGYVLYIAYQVFLLLPVGAACYLFPVLSRFTFQTGGLLANCLKLAVAHLPTTALLGVILSLAVWACSLLPPLMAVLPVVVAWLQVPLLERIFRPYIQEQRGESEDV